MKQFADYQTSSPNMPKRMPLWDFPSAYAPYRDFYGRGKILLTGEYGILMGAKSLALSVLPGQRMTVRFRASQDPHLYWRAIDVQGELWFEEKLELWHFNPRPWHEHESTAGSETQVHERLQKLLIAARLLNPHFLRESQDVFVETRLDFPLHWGLGSSSTLIYMVAQWAQVKPQELHRQVSQGSGYDVLCAGESVRSLLLQRQSDGMKDGFLRRNLNLDQLLLNDLYLLPLGQKKWTELEVQNFNQLVKQKTAPEQERFVAQISSCTQQWIGARDRQQLMAVAAEHESVVGEFVGKTPVQQRFFDDFPGVVKSLGAWGGDLVLFIPKDQESSAQLMQDYREKKFLPAFIPLSTLLYPSLTPLRPSATASVEK